MCVDPIFFTSSACLGSHHVSRRLNTVWDSGEWTPTRITLNIVFIERNGELIGALENDMEELVLPREETETPLDVELSMEILIGIAREEAHETGSMLHREILPSPMPKPQIIV